MSQESEPGYRESPESKRRKLMLSFAEECEKSAKRWDSSFSGYSWYDVSYEIRAAIRRMCEQAAQDQRTEAKRWRQMAEF